MNRILATVLAVTTSLLLTTGCGNMDDDRVRPTYDLAENEVAPSSSPADFIGTFSFNGTTTLRIQTADGSKTNTEPAQGQMDIAAGSDADVVLLTDGCAFPAMVKGNVATVRSGYICQTTNDGVSLTMTATIGTLTRVDNVVTVTMGGPMTLVSQGKSFNGDWSIQYTLTKLTK